MNLRLERRLAPRRNVSIPAQVVFESGRVRLDCVIRNVSDTGARIEVTGVARIPRTFDLVTHQAHPQPCVVVWRSVRELGVQFPLNSPHPH